MMRLLIGVLIALLTASAADGAGFRFRLKNSTFVEGTSTILIDPDDRLLLEVHTDGAEKDLAISYRCEVLVRGDIIYNVDPTSLNVTGVTPRDEQTQAVLNGEQKLELSRGGDGAQAGEVAIALPKRYGCFKLDVTVRDAAGNRLATWSTPYAVLLKPPADDGSSILGYDGWGYTGSYGRAPDAAQNVLLRRSGMR